MIIMEKRNFFIKNNEIKEIIIFGQKFKYKKPNANDELNWIEDYKEIVTEKDKDGKETRIFKQNYAKLAKCKLRNIVSVPFTKDELKEINGLNKEFEAYTNKEKDELFSLLDPTIMNKLIQEIDKTRKNQKKS